MIIKKIVCYNMFFFSHKTINRITLLLLWYGNLWCEMGRDEFKCPTLL